MNSKQFEDTDMFAEYYSNCSRFRQIKIDKMRFDKDKRLSLSVGALMDYGLRKYGLREADIEYETTKEGKPLIKGHNDIYFNATHSGEYAAVCFSATPVGIDIQQYCKYNPRLAERFFAKSEYQDMMLLPEKSQQDRFFRLWTLKESYIKFTGQGMKQELDSFYFKFGQNDNLLQSNFENCHFLEYIPAKDYRMAVCIGDKIDIEGEQ